LKNGTLEKNEPYQISVVISGGTVLQVGEAQVQVKKTIENFCGLNWQL